jgi:hypothetical protein
VDFEVAAIILGEAGYFVLWGEELDRCVKNWAYMALDMGSITVKFEAI